ncbi:hypothetical protein CYLTODRAFT_213641 [Cylindrobasidium torrendii FP15055 ss-10]|uniref:Uncharacterized protein n=1 Tax=Cylindrobasidium torrendii FP15055 ss-10 TaxID=1314674 RepID=A0A0D7BGN2_9AGAR|nr:hypothetical protein CYLTODRAFT_213641 [Cylindrobasidium torrendii FP15055 ss-10]
MYSTSFKASLSTWKFCPPDASKAISGKESPAPLSNPFRSPPIPRKIFTDMGDSDEWQYSGQGLFCNHFKAGSISGATIMFLHRPSAKPPAVRQPRHSKMPPHCKLVPESRTASSHRVRLGRAH